MSRDRCHFSLYLLVLMWAAGAAYGPDANAEPPQSSPPLTVMGIGGAGGMYTPAVSPVDPKVMFISCDMSGTYRSEDGGKTWAMLHWRELSELRQCRPAFVGQFIYWVSSNTLKVSQDQGKTWSAVVEGQAPWGGEHLQCLAGIESGQKSALLVGTDAALWRSTDLGRHWSAVAGSAGYSDLLVLGGQAYGISQGAVMSSTDNGGAWTKAALPADAGTQASLTGGRDASGATCLYATGEDAIVRSIDQGKTWEVVDRGHGCNMIRMAANQTQVAYAAQGNGREVFVTRDGGKSWQNCFQMSGSKANVQRSWVQVELHWGYRIMPLGLGADPADASVALLSTQGDFYITRDAARTWQQCMNTPAGKVGDDSAEAYRCNGLEVTSSWEYLFDPFDKNRTYIAYTDIGFCRSLDRGQTWISSTEGCPWGNTFYKVIFDPAVKGRLYAACSTRHDIPTWSPLTANKSRDQGGVCVSDDYGAHWQVSSQGLPTIPCTSICLDPGSDSNGSILYAAMYEGGVYKSTDNGKSWVKKSNGLGNKGNRHALMVTVDAKSHDVYCSITGQREDSDFRVPGGLWKSTDGGEHWVDLTRDLKLRWATGFAFDKQNPQVIYLAAATAPHFAQGGLYKTADGGAHWQHIVTDADLSAAGGESYSQCLSVTLRPGHPDDVSLGAVAHGLWMSKNAGKTFTRVESLPFASVAGVTFDPSDLSTMYVATHGGGVWRGRVP